MKFNNIILIIILLKMYIEIIVIDDNNEKNMFINNYVKILTILYFIIWNEIYIHNFLLLFFPEREIQQEIN